MSKSRYQQEEVTIQIELEDFGQEKESENHIKRKYLSNIGNTCCNIYNHHKLHTCTYHTAKWIMQKLHTLQILSH